MNKQVEIFKPGIAELKALAEKNRNLKINGVDDVEGYEVVKIAKKELADWRILITKSGKQYREEALAYQREVIRQEKEHLDIIVPLENELKAQLEAIDEAKKREERKVLLPTRRAMIEELKIEMTDDEILDMDEKTFGEMYTAKRMEFLEAKEKERLAEEEKKRRTDEIEQAKKEAADNARKEAEAKAEKDKQDEINKLKAEQERKDREAKEKIEREKRAEEARVAEEKRKKEALEKDKKYQEFLSINNYNKATDIIQENNGEVKLYRLINSFKK